MSDVDEWVSKQAIAELIARYNRAVDDQNLSALSSLFAEDGVLDTMGQLLEGRAAIAGLFGAAQADASARPESSHHVSNVVITLNGETASAQSDFLVVRRAERGVEAILAGRYIDRLRRGPGGWLFTHRRTEPLARPKARTSLTSE